MRLPHAAAHWPVVLRHDAWSAPPGGTVVLRPLRTRDEAQWASLRRRNARWLLPWDATEPGRDPSWRAGRPPLGEDSSAPLTFRQYVRALDRAARARQSVPLVIVLDGEMVGQVSASGLVWGAQRSGSVGYWVSEHVAGRAVAPTAVAMLVDHCFDTLGLHRLEVCVRPENGPSLRVAAKLGMRDEGVRPRFVHIAGQWRDHRVFAVDTADLPGPGAMLRRWTESHGCDSVA